MNKKTSAINSIGSKIVLILTSLSAVSILIVTLIAIGKSSSALKQEAFHKLEAVQMIKKTQIEALFAERLTDVRLAVKSRDVQDTLSSFIQYHNEMGIAPGAEFDMTGSSPDLTRKYDDIYAEANGLLSKYTDIYGFHDVFLICQEHGHVMYSWAREDDLGTNLGTGKYKKSHLAELWREARDADGPILTDMKAYEPSNGAPAIFIGAPVIKNGRRIGVFVIQLTVIDIDTIMQERAGFGQTGETILVGPDKRMRSNSFLDPVDHSIKASFAGTVDENGVDSKAVKAGLAGEQGQEIIQDYRGKSVLVSYAPLTIPGLTWVIIAKVDEAEINKPSYSLAYAIIIAAFLVLIVVVLLAVLVSRTISRPVLELKEITEKISAGDFNERIEKIRTDELGDLGRSINTMTSKLQNLFAKNKDQLWLADGISQVSEIVRGESDLRRTSDNLCQFFAHYLECQIITFYVFTNDRLELAGSYAFNKRKNLGKSIEVGEGFVGQAALEKQIISVTDIPEDYTRINSSIGDKIPGNIVVIPFLYNGQVQGVMEVGVFKELSDDKFNFLKRTIEPIGITIHTINEQARVRSLLEQTQEQAQELQTQQEELRAANENLEQQTHLLKASEEELQQQSEELRVSNEELEEKQETLQKQKQVVEAAKADVDIKVRELALASKYKSEFLANMSHELRTPLNSLLLLSKGLAENRKGNLDPVEVEDARIIYEGGNDLLRLINDIMDLSKVEAGKLGVNIADVRLEAITRNLHKIFDPVADSKELNFIVEVEDNFPDIIQSDGQRLEQILRNFLSNAMKFTENGSVSMQIKKSDPGVVFRTGKLQPDTTIAFTVIDTGVGIPLDKQQAIFEAFQQQDGSTSRKYGGTGLGLTISRELARLLGGEIQLASSPGKGSSFTLYLPKEAQRRSTDPANLHSQAPSRLEEVPVKEPGISIDPNTAVQPSPQFIPDDRQDIQPDDKTLLIIEDDEKFAKILRDHGRNNGYKCLVAGDGRGGLYLAMEYEPDGIVLDIGLPDIDGHQVLEQLKFSLTTRHIPVQIMSAFDKEQSRSMMQGAIGYLTKPVTREQLDTVLHEIADISKDDIRHLLVIEDDEGNQRAITSVLENSGTKVKLASTGKQGCAEILSNKYDCVILDLGLPDMSGFDVLKQVDAQKTGSLPPIIIYTGKEITVAEQTELNQYSSSIIVKGAGSPERLLDDVSLFLHNVEANYKNGNQETIRMLHDDDAMLKDRKILLVDDDMRNTYALSKKLIDVGLNVEMASDGKQAVDILKKDSSYELVLMDIMMPIMDGYEATREIRKMVKLKDIPVIALTAKAMPEDRNKCLAAGASEYLTKPIDFDKLLSVMRVWLFEHR